MTGGFVLVLILPLALWITSSIWSLAKNYAIARKVGLPIIIVPVSPENPIWMLLAKYVLRIAQCIPFGNGYFSRFCHLGWEYDEKSRAHLELGDAFIFATPGKNWIYLCNGDTANDIIRRERQGEFSRPVEVMEMLDVFGPNVSTAQGADWQRQRKCTAATFNEHTNAIVWTESIRQARQMLNYWKATGRTGIRSTARDTRTFALGVLLKAGFGISSDFEGAEDKKRVTQSGALGYRDALSLVLENAILILALGPKLLQWLSFIPGLGRLSQATASFKSYMVDMFEEKSRNPESVKGAQKNLLTSLVRASVQDQLISQEEVLGNMFVFNFAGHDTTAHSLAYTFMLLAAHPDVQDWMWEEILHVSNREDPLQWNYEAMFPKMRRTLAVLYETLRLYDPILSVVKGTASQSARLKIGDTEYHIPAHTRVVLNLNALHSHPRYWGEDALEWKPSRWITTEPGNGPSVDREKLVVPHGNTFLPFSEGMRACPGKKFAQVEHVALMAAIFYDHVVEPVRETREDATAAQQRILGVVEDTGMKLLLQMLHPERGEVRWRRRM